jgi:hypothetical protein
MMGPRVRAVKLSSGCGSVMAAGKAEMLSHGRLIRRGYLGDAQ